MTKAQREDLEKEEVIEGLKDFAANSIQEEFLTVILRARRKLVTEIGDDDVAIDIIIRAFQNALGERRKRQR